MTTKSPYRKLCNQLKAELEEINREIESLPSSLTDLLSSKIQNILRVKQDKTALKVSSITSRIEKVRSQARSAIDNIERHSSQSSDELSWKEKLIDILLDVDVILQDLADKAKTSGIVNTNKEVSANDLPDKLSFEIVKSPQNNKEKALSALKDLLDQGVLTSQEYEEKVKKLKSPQNNKEKALSALKDLLDQGVLTSQEYEEKVKNL
jgi:Short C-terminal domain